ncbi:hypothetical protein Nepgr_024558 [Nepenthes gracilis]|uniref:Uncharacterized protein n=1 Tax=Nepenthes gracilis TaxID=150966 RepID=A0AAD3T3J0_NEPGR|nr:hypothetical protein Nepgr_024558 [Nepenthes gracilis]
MGPIRFLRLPPGFEKEEASTSLWRRRPRRADPSLHHVARAVEDMEILVQATANIVEQVEARTVLFKRESSEFEARVSRLAGANLQGRDRIQALQEELEQVRARLEAECVWPEVESSRGLRRRMEVQHWKGISRTASVSAGE